MFPQRERGGSPVGRDTPPALDLDATGRGQVRKMQSQLCEICLSIDPAFWSEEFDDIGFPWAKYVKLQPFKSMQAAAARGCHLCQILLASAQEDFLDEWTLEKINVTLSRATIDSHQGVCLAVGNDDISHTIFYRVPEPWSMSMTLIETWFLLLRSIRLLNFPR